MTDMNRLECRYRRMLRAYPPEYRRIRGDEIITTLLDAAQDGHASSIREEIGLVLGGVRQRFAAPNLASRLAVMLVAVFTALLGAMSGALGGWVAAADLPDEAQSDQLAQRAFSTDHIDGGSDHAYLFGWDEFDDQSQTTVFMGGDDYGNGYRERSIEHEPDDFALLYAAHENLDVGGWEVSEIRMEGERGAGFDATRGGVALEVETSTETSLGPAVSSDHPQSSVTSVHIERAQPWTVPGLTLVGLVMGAVLGWWAAAAVTRRVTRWRTQWRVAVALPFASSVIAFTPPMLFNLGALGLYMGDLNQPNAFWIGFIHPLTGYPTLAGTLCLLLTLSVVAVGWFRDPWREPAPQSEAGKLTIS